MKKTKNAIGTLKANKAPQMINIFFVTGFTIFGTLKLNKNCFMKMLSREKASKNGRKGEEGKERN